MLRVNTAGVQAMDAAGVVSVGELNVTIAPAGQGPSCQVSAVTAQADTRYLAKEAASVTGLAAVAHPVIGV
ncbi:hypothetical protein [Mycobacterium heidelbergense]|nr:hypothetical protein [Mycobacterium heidelbergense]